MSTYLLCTREISTCCLGPALIRMVMLFSPNYNIPGNQYLTTKTTGLGSYTLTKVSTPSVSSGTLILSSRFNPTEKYPLDLNFHWGAPTQDLY